MSTVLGIDPSVSGAAGDMLVSALLPLAKKIDPEIENKIRKILSTEITKDFDFEISNVMMNGFKGSRLVKLEPKMKLTINQLEMYFAKLAEWLKNEKILKEAWKLIKETEQEVHGKKDIHLHELGSFDTIFDIFVTCFLIETINPEFIQISPVNVGTGTVKTSHGVLPVPPPVTEGILEKTKLPTIAQGRGELLTPTGAALIGAIQNAFPKTETIVWESSNFGFGTKSLDGRINAVRIRIGKADSPNAKIALLVTNVDDISGEILGNAIEELLNSGAIDVSYIPITTKKNRPGWQIQVIAPLSKTNDLAENLMKLTGSLGVRIQEIARHLGKREIKKIKVEIDGKTFSVRLKKGPYSSKIEFEDLLSLAKRLGKSPLMIQRTLKILD